MAVVGPGDGTVCFWQQCGSHSDYRLALEALDYYNQEAPGESVTKFLLEDGLSAYSGEEFEQVLARVYFSLALWHEGDEGNAFALLRQAEEVQQKKQEMYRLSRLTENFQLIENPVAKYLMAAVLENRGDVSQASLLYRQTAQLLHLEQLPPEMAPQSKGATVILICHNGNAPRKISETSDASIASAIALEMILCSQHIDPAISSLTGIPVPALMQTMDALPSPVKAWVDGEQKELISIYDVRTTAAQQLDQKLPLIVARGAARFLTRRGAVALCPKTG